MKLRLLSWNVHTPPLSPNPDVRLARIAEKIKSLAPDLVLLQEVWFDSGAALLERELGDRYEMIPVEETRTWPLRPSGLLACVARGSRGGKRRLAVRASDFVAFREHAPSWRIWQGDGLASKGVHHITLGLGERTIEVLNTHLQAQYGETHYDAIRRQQRATLERVARKLAGAHPVIACGDLNSSPDELDRAFWQDHTEALRSKCGCGTSLSPDPPAEAWIDFVLSRRSPRWKLDAQLQMVESRMADDPYSDHQGLLADFVISPLRPSPSLSLATALGGVVSLCGRSPTPTRRQVLARTLASGLFFSGSGRVGEDFGEDQPSGR